MNYLYHGVPEQQKGDILYPLNRLKTIFPDVYAEEVKKYAGREYTLRQKLPKLDCLWNDVLHFTAVHPKFVKQALIEGGQDPNFTRKYYQVPAQLLDSAHTVVYLYQFPDEEESINERNIIPFKPQDMERYSNLPKGTKAYYKEEIAQGLRPLLYHLVPHILFRGELDTTSLTVVTV